MTILHERSVEFQLKVDATMVGTESSDIDAALYAKVQEVISRAVQKLAGKSRLKLEFPTPWLREGIRYDTSPRDGLFREHNISLAIEATDQLTKYKCKQHHFIPELLCKKPKSALCYPKNKGTDVKFKLEQDIHFDNCKYCASGSLFLKGRRTHNSTVFDFSRLFPEIEQIAPADTVLSPVSHWQETVCGKMITAWREVTIEWNLVIRRDFQTHALLEAELSYKIIKSMKDKWDYDLLKLGSQLYLDLRLTGIFRLSPPIFYFHDPVSGVEIT
ncbi:MAG: hypothetical protein PHP85_03110 [Gallionella sp.]|nr:hypothetical protein [Gallionella sp.]